MCPQWDKGCVKLFWAGQQLPTLFRQKMDRVRMLKKPPEIINNSALIFLSELVTFSKSIGRDSLKYLSLLKKENPNMTELKGVAGQLQRTINGMSKEAEVGHVLPVLFGSAF